MIFYLLTFPEKLADNMHAEWTDRTDFEQILCPKVKGHMRAGKRATDLYVSFPDNYDDVVWTWYSECLINEKILNLLIEGEMTGYKIVNVSIETDKRRRGDQRDSVYELVATGDGGNIDSSSGYEILSKCKYCGKVKKKHARNGLIVDERQWDKSDIFVLREYPKFILVTEKIKTVFEQNHVTGCEFKLAQNIKID